jgi:uncharacterized integral membrane protein
MRFLGWLLTIPILCLLIGFALENQQSVSLGFWLFGIQITMPLSLLALGLLALGFILGSFTSWLRSLGLRIEARKLRIKACDLTEKRAACPPVVENRRKTGFFSLPFQKRNGDRS